MLSFIVNILSIQWFISSTYNEHNYINYIITKGNKFAMFAHSPSWTLPYERHIAFYVPDAAPAEQLSLGPQSLHD
jgi:hypothetical protein